MLLLPYAVNTQALSASSAKTIEGTAPYFILVDNSTVPPTQTALINTNELLGFTMPDGAGGRTKIIRTGLTQTVTIPKEVKEDEILTLLKPDTSNTARTLNTLIGTGDLIVTDSDGDASAVGSTSALGKMKVTLLRDGNPITPSSSTFSVCASSYQLVIEIDTAAGADKVTAKTTYGAPNYREYTGSDKVTYTLIPQGVGICYIQPKNMGVFTGACDATSCKWAEGYNPAVWDLGKGFKKAALTKAPITPFPTTGFDKAELRFIGSGTNQNLYTCKKSAGSGNWAKLATTSGITGNGCTVIYDYDEAQFDASGMPTGDITIEMGTGIPWAKVDEYVIPAPSKWALGGAITEWGNSNYMDLVSRWPALEYCRQRGTNKRTSGIIKAEGTGHAGLSTRMKFIYSKEEISNGLYANNGLYPDYDGGSFLRPGYFYDRVLSRDADRTYTGEWGELHDYIGSPWGGKKSYWVAEALNKDYAWVAKSNGSMWWAKPSEGNTGAVCRGELAP